DREDDPRPVIDALHAAVGPGAGESVEENHGERNARDQLGVFRRINDQQDRHQNEAAAGADQSAEGADRQPEGEKPEGGQRHFRTAKFEGLVTEARPRWRRWDSVLLEKRRRRRFVGSKRSGAAVRVASSAESS